MFSPLTVKTPIARAPTRPASCANRILGTLPRAPSEIFTSIQFKIVLHCWRHFFSDTTSNCASAPLGPTTGGEFLLRRINLLFRVESTHRFKQSGGPGSSTPLPSASSPARWCPRNPPAARGAFMVRAGQQAHQAALFHPTRICPQGIIALQRRSPNREAMITRSSDGGHLRM